MLHINFYTLQNLSPHLDQSHGTKLNKAFVQKTTVKEPMVSEVPQESQPKLHALAVQKPPPIVNSLIGGAGSLQVAIQGVVWLHSDEETLEVSHMAIFSPKITPHNSRTPP